MVQNSYTISDFILYLEEKRDEFIAYRKNGLEYVNMKLIELGKTLGEYPDIWKTKDNKVKGCTSNVFIHSYLVNGKFYITGSSNSEIVKGQLALLINGLNMLTPSEIVNQTEKYLNKFVKDTDVRFSMTVTRANSLGTLYQFIKNKAANSLN